MENYFSFLENKEKSSINNEKMSYKADKFSANEDVLFDSRIMPVLSPESKPYVHLPRINLASPVPEYRSKIDMLSPDIVMNTPTPITVVNAPTPEAKFDSDAFKTNENNAESDSNNSANVITEPTEVASQRGRRRLINNK